MEIWKFIQNSPVDVSCPQCGTHKRITIRDVSLGRAIICPSCELRIRLIDKDASSSNVKRKTQQIENQITDMFKGFNK